MISLSFVGDHLGLMMRIFQFDYISPPLRGGK